MEIQKLFGIIARYLLIGHQNCDFDNAESILELAFKIEKEGLTPEIIAEFQRIEGWYSEIIHEYL